MTATQIITRFTKALTCFRLLTTTNNHLEDFSSQFNLTRCFSGGEAAAEKFCLVHIGLDPLPISGTIGGCIPDECSNIELTDLLNVICALPSCEVLAPMTRLFQDDEKDSIIMDICGYAQRAICGPDDRTMMQHEISFTCVPPPHQRGRRRLSTSETGGFEVLTSEADASEASASEVVTSEASEDDVMKGLKDLENEVVEIFRKVFDYLHIDDLVKFTSHLIVDLENVVGEEVEKFWSDLRDDLKLDKEDLKNLFADKSVLENIARRIRVRIEALHDSLNVLEKRLKGDDVEKMKNIISDIRTQLTDLAHSDLVKLQENVRTLREKITTWLHHLKAESRQDGGALLEDDDDGKSPPALPSAELEEGEQGDWAKRRIIRQKLSEAVAAMAEIERAEGDWGIEMKLKEILEKLKLLIDTDLPILQDDITEFFKDFDELLRKIRDIIFPHQSTAAPPQTTTADSLQTSTVESSSGGTASGESSTRTASPSESPSTKSSLESSTEWNTITTQLIKILSTASADPARREFAEIRILEEALKTTSTAAIVTETETLSSTEAVTVEDLEKELMNLRDLFVAWLHQIHHNQSTEAKESFEKVEKLVVKIGQEFKSWGQAQIIRAKALLQKFRQKYLMDKAKNSVKASEAENFDHLEEVERILRELMAIRTPADVSSENRRTSSSVKKRTDPYLKEWPEAVSKFLKDFGQFAGDVAKVGTKAFTEAATDETIRRDFEKLNRRFQSLSFLFTEDVVKVWDHWKMVVGEDLEKITKTVDEIDTRIKKDLEDRLKEDEEFRKSIFNEAEEIGNNWNKFWQNFWNQTISVEHIAEQIKNLTQTLSTEIRERVQLIIDGIHNEEAQIRLRLEESINKLRDDVQRMVDELKQKIDEIKNSGKTTSTQSVTTQRTSSSTQSDGTVASSSTSQSISSKQTVTQNGQSTTKESHSTHDINSNAANPALHDARALGEISIPDLSMMSEEILEVLKTFNADTKLTQQFFDNATFFSEIAMHFRPTAFFREIDESKPLWTTQEHLESVFTCGLQSLTVPSRLLNSGHMPQSLGDYEACLGEDQRNSANRYCLVKGAAIIGEGRCVAHACDEQKMRELTDFICSWIQHHRSCLELSNIIPIDYCLFASLANCGTLSNIPNAATPADFIALPAWYNSSQSRIEGQSWWSPDELAAMSLLSGESHKLTQLWEEDRQLDYNMTEIVNKLGLPRYQVYCSQTEDSYWNWRSILGWFITVTLLVVLPTLSYLLPRRYLGNWRIGKNFKHWLSRSVRAENSANPTSLPTASLDGMRVISILWIIWGHTLVTVLASNLLENYEETIDLIRSFKMQGVISGVFAVDTFIAVSAFLLAFKSAKTFGPSFTHETADDILLWFKSVLIAVYKRWARLSPLYYFVFAFFVLVVPNLVSAPMYAAYTHSILYGMADKQGCNTQWFNHLLYLDNLVPNDSIDACMGWSWYLAVEMQLSILGIALVALACRSRQAYSRLWWLAFILAFAWTLTLELQNHFTLGFLPLSSPDARIDTTTDFETAMARHRTYIRPWPRMIGYLLALSAGLHLADEQRRLEASNNPESNTTVPATATEPLLVDECSPSATPMMLRSELSRPPPPRPSRVYEPVLYRKIKNLIIPGHLIALITMAVIIWLPWYKGRYYTDDWPYALTLFYNLFSRGIWTTILLWFVYTCFLAHHKIIKDPLTTTVNKLLSSKYFTLLSPLVFGVYLIHMLIQGMYYASIPMTAVVSLSEGFHEALGWIPLSFSIALPLYLLIELPAARTL